MKFWNQIWTEDRWRLAQDMRLSGSTDAAIARAVNLTKQQVRTKFANTRHERRRAAERSRIARLLSTRDDQAAAAGGRSLTAEILNDPPPGRSALDKIRSGAAR